LVDAKVDVEVIKAFVKNSAIPFSPSAAEIIALREHGVPPEVIVAMLQRGSELKTASIQGAAAPADGGAYSAAPSYPSGPEPLYPSYSYGYPDYYSYPAYNYSPYYG